MHTARNTWHSVRPTTFRATYHVEIVPRQHVCVIALSTYFRPIPSGSPFRYPRSPLTYRSLNFPLHRYLQQRWATTKPSSLKDKKSAAETASHLNPPSPKPDSLLTKPFRENIYTFPNLLTLSRIASCPVLGWAILSDNHVLATGLLVYAGVTDWVRAARQLSLLFQRRCSDRHAFRSTDSSHVDIRCSP